MGSYTPCLFDFETINSEPYVKSSQPLEVSQPVPQKSKSSLLLVAAVGLGKTVMMGGLAKHWPVGRVMMISHRYELNTQAIRTFEAMCGEEVDLEQAMYMADRRAQPHRIVVASVQTLNSKRKGHYRMERFNPMDFGLLMIDEAHRAAADSYRRVVEYFRKGNPNLKVVGVTATPDRADGVGMSCVFEDAVGNFDIKWGIENGWLVPPKQIVVELDSLDLRDVATVGGDLDNKQLAKVVEQEKNLHGMAKPIVDFAGRDKQAIVFAASVEQAKRLSELIRDYYERAFGSSNVDTAIAIDGSMSPQDPQRIEMIRKFKAGEIQFLCNVGVATEGFDAPNVRLIAIGRPTKSRALYVQCLGRGTRPLAGTVETPVDAAARIEAIKQSAKPYCEVLDFVGQSGRHSLVCATDFLAGTEPDEVRERANKISSRKAFDGSTLDALKEAKEQIAAEREAKRKKVTVGVNYRTSESTAYSTTLTMTAQQLVKPGLVSQKQANYLLALGYTHQEIAAVRSRGHLQRLFQLAATNPRNQCARNFAQKQAAEKSQ